MASDFKENFIWTFINHPNPNNSKYFDEKFKINENIQFIEPLPYPQMLKKLSRCYLLITDSGGFQEEATFLGLPTLVLRKYTERPEAMTVGSCLLIRNIEIELEEKIRQLLENESELYKFKAKSNNVFGIGDSANKIVEKIQQIYTC
jgi:UDP-N-acetylglucosamine 2-epimerase (non-hydrolysing)